MAGAGSSDASGPFLSRDTCRVTSDEKRRDDSRPYVTCHPPLVTSQAARQLAQPSLQNSVCSGQHRGGLPIWWGRGCKVKRLPCKRCQAGAFEPLVRHQLVAQIWTFASRNVVPPDSTNSILLRGTRPRNRGRPHKPVQVGVTPTPATILLVDVVWNERESKFLKTLKTDALIYLARRCQEWQKCMHKRSRHLFQMVANCLRPISQAPVETQ